MNIPIRPPVFSQEECDIRQQLRAKMNLAPFLSQRTAFNVGAAGIHCELYEYSTDAPTILFLPGIATYSELYAEMLCKLSQQGFNVVAIDPPGHGYSAGERGLYSVEAMSNAVSMVLNVLEQRFPGPFAIYGYSIGALLALAAAERDERLKAVLAGTLLIPDLAPDLAHRIGWSWMWTSALVMPTYKVPLQQFMDFQQLLKGHPAAAEINRDPLIVFDYPLQTLASLFSHRCKSVYKTSPFSLAVLQGDRDEILPVSYARRVERYCEQPMELIIAKYQGHMMSFLAPDKVAELAAAWFKRTL